MAFFEVNNAWLTEFDAMFHSFLKYQGGKLVAGVLQEPVIGATKLIRQMTVGDGHYITSAGGNTEYTSQIFDRRRIQPKDFAVEVLLDKIDLRLMGNPDVGQYAQEMANSAGKMLDQIILEGIGGASWSESAGGEIFLADTARPAAPNLTPADYDGTNTIAWADYTIGLAGDSATTPKMVKSGLNSSKITKAVKMLREKFSYGPIICIGSEHALMTLRADPFVSNGDFSYQRTLADGINSPWGGVQAFVACDLVPKNVRSKLQSTNAGNPNVNVEYVYVYCMDQIRLGIGSPLQLETGQDAGKNLNTVLIYSGAYGSTRMFENSVVRIEVETTGTVAPANAAAWNF